MSNSYPGGLLTAGADTSYSVAFDGTTDYLTIPNAAWMNLGTSDFTMECWVYFNVVSATQMFVSNSYNASTGAGGWAFAYRQDNTTLKFSVNSNVAYEKTWSPTTNKWYHVAVSRSGSSLRMFVDGTQVGTTSTSTDNISGASSTMWVGSNETTSYAMNGYISSMRITTTALYTTTFTPPTQLFSVPGTQFLSLQNPRFVDVSNNAAVITAVGDVKVSNFTPFAGYKGFNPKLGAAAGGVWTLEQASSYQSNRTWPIYDPYYNYNTLLLRGNGSNTATNSTFTDGSSNNFTITRNGNTTQGSFSPFNPKGYSLYLPGSDSSYVQTPSSTTTALLGGSLTSLGSLSFTVECFINTPGNIFLVGACDPGGGTADMILSIGSDGLLAFGATFGGYTTRYSSGAAPLNTWCHVAWVVTGGYVNFYVNGVPVGSATVGNTAGSYGQLIFGGYNNSFTSKQYISNFRITKSAIYNGPFKVPTSKLTALPNTTLLTFQENNFKDNSANNYTLTRNGLPVIHPYSPFAPTNITPTTYSNWFDGSTGYLTLPSGSDFAFGTGDFTVELWAYSNSTSSQYFIDARNSGQTSNWYFLNQVGTPNIVWGSSSPLVATTTAPTYQWNHFVYCRSGTTGRMFLNGIQIASQTDNDNYSVSPTTSYIGCRYNQSEFFSGTISNLRVVKGTALYTSNFTPPSAPLTDITGTSLLTCQSSTLVDTSSSPLTITSVGTVYPVTSPTPYPAKVDQTTINATYLPAVDGGSAFFDGTGDSLSLSSTSLNLSSSDFTIETWIYATTTDRDTIIGSISDSAGLTAWMLMLNETGSPVRFYCRYNGGTTLDYKVGSGSFPIHQWVHVAVTRNGANLRIFVNGVQTGTTNTSLSTYSIDNASTNYYFGRTTDDTANFTGYLSGTRILVGTALYTQNFAPPISPPTAVANTRLLTNFTNAGIFDQTGTENFEAVSNDPPKISTLQSKWGGSSIAFNSANTGSSIPYLLANRHTNHHAFYGGDFTVEAWVYILANNNLGGPLPIVNYGNGGANGPLGIATAWSFNVQNNGAGIQFYRNTDASTEVNVSFTGTVPYNQWAHVAVSRTGTALRAFVNGIQIGSTSTSSTSYAPISGTNRLFVGAGSGGGGNAEYYKFPGYMQDVRVTKGIARYTSNFIPPTSGMQNQ